MINAFIYSKKQKTERFKIVVAINSLVATRHQAYSNHVQMFFRLGRNFPHIDFIFFNPDRMSIDRMRNQAAEIALQTDARYLLFIDDDVLVPFTFLVNLLAVNADIVAGDVCIRGYPFDHMIFQWSKKKTGLIAMSKLPVKKGVIDAGAVGFSCCMIKTELLKKMQKPYFITGVSNTEDIYFCLKAKEQVPNVKIRVDTRVVCPHILWDELISSENKENYKKYYQKQFPEACNQQDESINRGKKYLEMVEETIDDKKH